MDLFGELADHLRQINLHSEGDEDDHAECRIPGYDIHQPRLLPGCEEDVWTFYKNNIRFVSRPERSPEMKIFYEQAYCDFSKKYGMFCFMPRAFIRLDELGQLDARASFHTAGILTAPNTNLLNHLLITKLDKDGSMVENMAHMCCLPGMCIIEEQLRQRRMLDNPPENEEEEGHTPEEDERIDTPVPGKECDDFPYLPYVPDQPFFG